MYCSNCGKSVAAGARFCGSCGQPIANTSNTPSGGGSFDPAQPSAAMAGAVTAGAVMAGAPGAPAEPFVPDSEQGAPGLIARVRGILLAPKQEWPRIAHESSSAMGVLQRYVVPLAAFLAVVSFVHVSLIGVSIPFAGTVRTPLVAGLVNAALTCVMGVVGTCIVAAIINALAPSFGGVREWRQAVKAAAYSLTPSFVGSLFGLLPAFGTLLGIVAGIYGIYVLYLGLPLVMRSPRERAGTYTAAVVVCTIVLGLLLGAVGAMVGVGSGRMLAAMTPAESREVQRERGAAVVANILGNALGTDEKGKAGLTTALSNLAKAGEQVEASQAAANRSESAASPSAARDSSRAEATSRDDAAAGGTSSSGASDESSRGASAAQLASVAAGAANGAPVAQRTSEPASAASGAGSANAVQGALGAAGGLLSALGGAMGGEHPKQPVDFHKLQDALPATVAGLPRTHLEGGSKQAMGIKAASAKATYGSGASRVQIEVSDMSGVAGLMDLASALPTTESSESDSSYEKQVTLSGRTAQEKFDSRSKHGELSTIVAKRFAVDVTSDGLSAGDLEKALGQVSLSSLESMKDAGGSP